MAIADSYRAYLEHFGETATVRTLHEQRDAADCVALRHDIDYDLDLALEMAWWEQRKGCRASYYLLHTAPYWDDPRLVEKCLQLEAFGHEVGLHANLLAEWAEGRIEDLDQRLRELLTPLREAGVRINGVAAHGDPLCYRHGFANYWCFEELRPEDPGRETGMSAEGIRVEDPRFQLAYPEDDALVVEGRRMPFWNLSMRAHGLDYHAVHVPHDQYWSDSGGGWKRSGDPKAGDFSRGRHQVLVHPIYWRGTPQTYFFLSTARSGSKWLSRYLNTATAARGLHEFTLNHRYREGEAIEEKRTGPGFVQLLEDPAKVEGLLRESRAWMEAEVETDLAEANVYLPHVLEGLGKVFPRARRIHLHRDPREVVRSLMNRDWYALPEDDRHPPAVVEHWEALSPFEKCCWYVREQVERLRACPERIAFADMVADPEYLVERLEAMELPVYPLLGKDLYGEAVNANKKHAFPAYPAWSEEQRGAFHAILDPVLAEFGYGVEGERSPPPPPKPVRAPRAAATKPLIGKLRTLKKRAFANHIDCRYRWGRIEAVCTPELNCYLLVGGFGWFELEGDHGWPVELDHYYRGALQVEHAEVDRLQVFFLLYDAERALLEKQLAGVLHPGQKELRFQCRPPANAHWFNLALYLPKSDRAQRFRVRSLELEAVSG